MSPGAIVTWFPPPRACQAKSIALKDAVLEAELPAARLGSTASARRACPGGSRAFAGPLVAEDAKGMQFLPQLAAEAQSGP